MIIINSARIATDLLDRRSAIYSDRPPIAFGGDFVGWSRATVLLPYGARHRASRRLIQQVIGTQSAVHKFDEIENDSHVNVSFYDEKNTHWASYSGIAEFSQDKDLIAKHWSPLCVLLGTDTSYLSDDCVLYICLVWRPRRRHPQGRPE